MTENDNSSDLAIKNHNIEMVRTYKPTKEFLTSFFLVFITMFTMITLIYHFNRSSPERITYLVSGQFGVAVFIALQLKEIFKAKADTVKNLLESKPYVIKEKKNWEGYFGKFETKEKVFILSALIVSIIIQLALSYYFNIGP